VREAKKEKNDNKLLRLTILALLITIIAVALVSGTFAKYTTSVSGTDTASIAKWQVKLNDTDVTTQTEAITLDLFQETEGVYDLATVANANDLSTETGSVDTDVIKGAKVAPGTWGKISFKLENLSEVTASYAVRIDELTTTLPLKFSVDGKTWKKASDIMTDINSNGKYSFSEATLAVGSAATTANLFWKWDFDEAGNTDTALGAAASAVCNITAGVTFTQVD